MFAARHTYYLFLSTGLFLPNLLRSSLLLATLPPRLTPAISRAIPPQLSADLRWPGSGDPPSAAREGRDIEWSVPFAHMKKLGSHMYYAAMNYFPPFCPLH
ncbi:hypothetical protein DFH09DRAFT_1146268, partial [Mycena vulgaris]